MTTSGMLVKQAVRATLFQIVSTGALVFCQQAPPIRAPLSVQCPLQPHQLSSDDQLAGHPQLLRRRGSFHNLIDLVGKEDEGIQQDIRDGRDRVPERRNWGSVIHIRDDEEQAVHTILVDAYYRLQQNQQKHFEKFECPALVQVLSFFNVPCAPVPAWPACASGRAWESGWR